MGSRASRLRVRRAQRGRIAEVKRTRSPFSRRAPVAQLDPPHRDRPDPGLHQPLRAMAVSHETVAPVRQPRISHRGKKRLGFRFDRLGEQAAGAVPQNRRQRIVDSVGLTEGNNSAIARHGVSAPSGVQAGFHPPRYAAFLTPPSPIFAHSSAIRRRGLYWRSPSSRLKKHFAASAFAVALDQDVEHHAILVDRAPEVNAIGITPLVMFAKEKDLSPGYSGACRASLAGQLSGPLGQVIDVASQLVEGEGDAEHSADHVGGQGLDPAAPHAIQGGWGIRHGLGKL